MTIPSATDITRDLVRFNTINPPGHEKLCSDYLGTLLLDAGFEIDSYQYGDERISTDSRSEPRLGPLSSALRT
jgi:succinyl-diaminopimelate desuccinylase